jgi:TonB family protein
MPRVVKNGKSLIKTIFVLFHGLANALALALTSGLHSSMIQLPSSGFLWCLVCSSVAHIIFVGIVMTEVGGAMLPTSGRAAAAAAPGLGSAPATMARLIIAEATDGGGSSLVQSNQVPSSEMQGEIRTELPSAVKWVAESTGARHPGRRQAPSRWQGVVGPEAPAAPPSPEGARGLVSPGAATEGLGGADTPPELITSDNPAPEYPEEARLAGHEGRVRVQVVISAGGTVEEESIVESSQHTELDRSALEAIRQWRFRPARRLGAPTSSIMIVPVVFRIEAE